MSLHQYIGARYVPYFYQNSLDPTSTEWEPNVNYEPLTVVTLSNLHSYISKKYVPDTIGSPALNAEYWLDRGYDNAYIQALQDEVDDMKDGTVPGSLQNQIDSLDTRVDALEDSSDIHDHYLKGDYERTLNASEILLVTDSFGQNPSGNVISGFNKCLSGINSLYQAGAHFNDFATMLTNYTGDKTAIKTIILIGGTNEHDVSFIAGRLASVKTASEGYPNATVYIAFIKSNFNSATDRAIVNSLEAEIRKESLTNNFVFLGNFNHCLYPTFAIIGSDGVHPTPTGGERIGSAIFNKYANDDNTPLIDASATATSKGITFEINCDNNGDISVRISGQTTENIAPGSYIDLDFNTYYYLASLPSYFAPTVLMLHNGSMLILGLRDNKLKYYLSSNLGNYPTGSNIIPQISLVKSFVSKKYKITNS